MILQIMAKDSIEITEGAVFCRACGLSYGITEGIVNALVFCDPAVKAARSVYCESKKRMPAKYTKADLSRREHLDRNYLHDTEVNFRDFLERSEQGSGWALDIGAGTGWTTVGLTGMGYRAVAIDISADNKLDLGKYHFKEGIYFDRVLADVNHLPFSDNIFDLTFASASLHHSRSLGAALGEISRTARIGARLELINEPVRGLAEAFQNDPGHLEGPEGVIEKHYGIYTWILKIKKAGYCGTHRFPASIRNRLDNGNFTSKHKFNVMARTVSKLYRLKLFRKIIEGMLFRFGMYIFGLPLIYSGIKRSDRERD
jgi:hypothetical protein